MTEIGSNPYPLCCPSFCLSQLFNEEALRLTKSISSPSSTESFSFCTRWANDTHESRPSRKAVLTPSSPVFRPSFFPPADPRAASHPNAITPPALSDHKSTVNLFQPAGCTIHRCPTPFTASFCSPSVHSFDTLSHSASPLAHQPILSLFRHLEPHTSLLVVFAPSRDLRPMPHAKSLHPTDRNRLRNGSVVFYHPIPLSLRDFVSGIVQSFSTRPMMPFNSP